VRVVGSATGEISRATPSAEMFGLPSSETTTSGRSFSLRRSLNADSAMAKTASFSPGWASRTIICPAFTTCPASAPTAVTMPSKSACSSA
jgi:hypothetical protein